MDKKKGYQEEANITSIKEVSSGYFLMRLYAPKIVKIALPGQFIMVECSKSLTPLLRRPFSFHGIYKDSKEVEILFKIVGNGTRMLSEKKVGEEINIIGPLGNKGFNILENTKNVAILARGIGIAPFKALIEDALLQKIKVSLYFSVKEEKLCSLVDNLRNLDLEIFTFVEFDEDKNKSLVLKEFYRVAKDKKYDQAFTCGSNRFVRFLGKAEKEFSMHCQVSLESFMACGVGSCIGCVIPIKVKNIEDNSIRVENKRVCIDGPVFWVREVV